MQSKATLEHEKSPAQDHSARDAGVIDKRIGAKINSLRMAMGITRQELAEKIGVTHQQLHKYENGTNRITASRLLEIAKTLNVSVMYFYEEFAETIDFEKVKHQRLCMEVMRYFINIPRAEQQDAIRDVLRVIAKG